MRLLCCLSLLALSGCAAGPPVLPPEAPAVELADTPFFAQERYQCGPAALATVLQASGVEVWPETLVSRVYIPEREGSLQIEMIAATRDYGRVPYVLEPSLEALLAEVRAGRPVLVMQNLAWDFYPRWHYAVVIGYTPDSDEIILRSGVTERLVMDADDFLDDWDKADRWAVVSLPPGTLPAADDPGRYLRAVADLEEAGHLEAAAQAYDAAAERWPDESAPWLGLGNVRYAQDDLAGAETAYRAALTRREDLAVARNNLAQVLAERGCTAEALRQAERAVADAPEALADTIRATRDEIAVMPARECGDPVAERAE